MTAQHTPDAKAIGGHFLNAQRLSVYPIIFLAVYVLAALLWVSQSTDMLDPRDKPLGYDFITFWSGATLAVDGNPADVFDAAKMAAAQNLAVPGNQKLYLWHYPPTFLLLILPLAVIPYIWAYLIWGAGTFLAYASVIRKMAPQPQTMVLLLAFPASFVNLMQGQNAFLTAFLFGGAMMNLERKPVLAGILIGLLSYKPHLGLLIPLALVCGRHWTTFAAAAATTVSLALISAAALGTEVWIAFFENLPVVRGVLDNQLISWTKFQSLYATLRLAGVGIGPAYGAQIVLSIAVAVAVGVTWWHRPALPLRAAVLVTGSLLATPYVFNYDLALLAIPIALLAMDGYVRGWLPAEREILALTWLMPLVTVGIAETTNLQIGSLCVAALFFVSVRRAHRSESSAQQC